MRLSEPLWTIITDSYKFRSFTLNGNDPGFHPQDMLNQGKRFGNSWEPLYVELFEDQDGGEKHKPLGDFAYLFGPSMSMKAKSILEPLVGNTVEFLPFETSIGPYYAINVSWVDCLDIRHSDVKRFSSGRIMRVNKYSFFNAPMLGIHLFHVPELRASEYFVSNEFKKLVEANDLRGLIFSPVVEPSLN